MSNSRMEYADNIPHLAKKYTKYTKSGRKVTFQNLYQVDNIRYQSRGVAEDYSMQTSTTKYPGKPPPQPVMSAIATGVNTKFTLFYIKDKHSGYTFLVGTGVK